MVKKGAMRDFFEVKDNLARLLRNNTRDVYGKDMTVRGRHH